MIRLFIAEDQRMLLGALGSLLDMEEDMEVIGQAMNGEFALASILELKPDVCLMDIEMPVLNGLEVAEELTRQVSPSKVMVGKRMFSPELTFDVIREENPLTPKEQEILRLATLGKTTKEIASELYFSSGTVRNYISEIINKLEAKNRMEAVSIAEKKAGSKNLMVSHE